MAFPPFFHGFLMISLLFRIHFLQFLTVSRPWQFVITFKLPSANASDDLKKLFEEDVLETSSKWQEHRAVF